jgi:hypothetical protein
MAGAASLRLDIFRSCRGECFADLWLLSPVCRPLPLAGQACRVQPGPRNPRAWGYSSSRLRQRGRFELSSTRGTVCPCSWLPPVRALASPSSLAPGVLHGMGTRRLGLGLGQSGHPPPSSVQLPLGLPSLRMGGLSASIVINSSANGHIHSRHHGQRIGDLLQAPLSGPSACQGCQSAGHERKEHVRARDHAAFRSEQGARSQSRTSRELLHRGECTQ